MIMQDFEGRWFAIQVRQSAEFTALAGLQSRGYEAYLPTYLSTREWSDRIRKQRLPLFPGYLFCRFNSAIRAPIVTTLGVVRILGAGGTPIPVEEIEIASLQAIETATGIHAFPWPRLEIGEVISICSGPLRGLKGVLQSIKGRDTLIVSVPLLQRSVAVEVRMDWIIREDGHSA